MNVKNILNIIHEDPLFVVVDKPSGLLSVPGRAPEMQDCVVNRLKKLYPHCMEQPSVHRLDMDTSGLLVLALTKEAHRDLSIQFQKRAVKKNYVALLEGIVKEKSGRIELPFRLDLKNRPYQIYDPVHGKMGITRWRRIRLEKGKTRVFFTPHTGRTHQLRLHAYHHFGLGVPICGDRLYGSGKDAGELKLHSCRLSFSHPLTQIPLTFRLPPPF